VFNALRLSISEYIFLKNHQSQDNMTPSKFRPYLGTGYIFYTVLADINTTRQQNISQRGAL
jgi:hypothetical protein